MHGHVQKWVWSVSGMRRIDGHALMSTVARKCRTSKCIFKSRISMSPFWSYIFQSYISSRVFPTSATWFSRAALLSDVCVLVQLVICIPMPDIATSMAKRPAPENIELNERLSEEKEEESLDDMGRRGHILWIRGLTRLQTQVLITHW